MAKVGKHAGGGDEASAPSRRESWKAISQRGIRTYLEEQPKLFQRRVRRGVPMDYRWEVWKAACHVEERAHPGLYQELKWRENQWTRLIEIDIPRTFPEMPLFDKEHQQSLLRVLNAYANHAPEVGYCQGMNFVAGLLLYVAHKGDFRITPRLQEEEEAFWMLVCLMGDEETEPGKLAGFYRKGFPLLRRYLWAFDQLVGHSLRDLQEHLEDENVQHAVYLHQWFLTLFINCLPLPMVLVFWDNIVCNGLEELLPITVSLLQILKGVLLALQFEDIVRFFKTMRACDEGCDPAAVARLVVLRGGSVSVPAHVTARLRARLSDDAGLRTPTSGTPSPVRPKDEALGLQGSPGIDGRSATSPEAGTVDNVPVDEGDEEHWHSLFKKPWEWVDFRAAKALGLQGSPGIDGRSATSPEVAEEGSTLLGSYFQQFSNLRRDYSQQMSQGLATWLEDARDNLERVGLGVPQRNGEVTQREREQQTRLMPQFESTPHGRQLRMQQKL